MFKQKFLTLLVQSSYMPHNTYRSLSLESLYELLSTSVRDMLVALDSKEDSFIAFKAIRKQVELLLELIEEKTKEKRQTSSADNTSRQN